MSNINEDTDLVLTGQYAWITVKEFSVRVSKTDEGVLVDIYALGQEDRGAIASTYAFDGEEGDDETEAQAPPG
jgi:hypothetical protein